MKITAVNFRTELVHKPGSRLIAVGSIELDGVMRIEYVRVVRANDGRFLVVMPSIVNGAGVHRDTVHPTTPEMRTLINDAVLSELKKVRPGDVQS